MARPRNLILIGIAVLLLLLLVVLYRPPPVSSNLQIPAGADAIERGSYLFVAGGCRSCHRDEQSGETMAGGHGIESDFGTFYAPNITPHPTSGIGNWQAADFIRAMKHGRTPSGSFYYPAFPYRAYAGLSDNEVLDIAAYLMSLEPVDNQVPEHDTPGWLNRLLMPGWNLLAAGSVPEELEFEDDAVARGAHLARNLAHCGECHTPRNSLGIPDMSREFAGAQMGEDTIEAIDATALEEWTTNNFAMFLLLGMTPESEFVGGDMNEVIEHNTSKLTQQDREALAAFFTRHHPVD